MLKAEIGKTAGEVWKFIGKNGKVSLADLATAMKVKPDVAHQAIGWLAREGKIEFVKQAKTTVVSLSPAELNHYRQTQKTSSCCL